MLCLYLHVGAEAYTAPFFYTLVQTSGHLRSPAVEPELSWIIPEVSLCSQVLDHRSCWN